MNIGGQNATFYKKLSTYLLVLQLQTFDALKTICLVLESCQTPKHATCQLRNKMKLIHTGDYDAAAEAKA